MTTTYRAITARATLGAIFAAIIATPLMTSCGPGRAPALSHPDRAQPERLVVRSEPWPFAGREGELLRSTHYRLYTTETDPILVRRLPGFLEYALRHYRSTFGSLPAPPLKLDTFVLSSRAEWEALTRQITGPNAETFLKIQRGGYAFNGNAVLFDIGARDTMAISAHEGWHQYTQRTFKHPLPIWLEEGIATYMEGHRWNAAVPVFLGWANIERFDQLRRAAANGDLLTFQALMRLSPQELLRRPDAEQSATLNYYAQLWALVHFLQEGERGKYAPGLRRLVQDASSGELGPTLREVLGDRPARLALTTRRSPDVARVYLNRDLSQIDREYGAFIRELIDRGNRSEIVAGRSPISSE